MVQCPMGKVFQFRRDSNLSQQSVKQSNSFNGGSMNTRTLIMVLVMISSLCLLAQPTKTFTDADIQAGEAVTMSCDTTYILSGLVYVEDGAVLTIEAGTIIKGQQTVGSTTSALIVARGGQVIADGTANNPIIFTSELDDINDPFDLTVRDRGLWGGVILLGYATVNTTTGTNQIEGIDLDPQGRGTYGGGDQVGGPDDADNSGTLRYVSIRHGGFTLSTANEINGLTMGGVGDGTT